MVKPIHDPDYDDIENRISYYYESVFLNKIWNDGIMNCSFSILHTSVHIFATM